MTQNLKLYTSQISTLLRNFSTDNKNDLKRKLNDFEAQNQQQNIQFNKYLQSQMKITLQKIMSKGDLNEISQLISLICQVSKTQNQPQASELSNSLNKKPSIKQSLAILLVQHLLQCLGINDLKQILPIISQKICSFKQLLPDDQNCMLRVINHLLKRISKTEDYLIRGQLQFTLTKILPICHDSGFHYRIPMVKGIQILEDNENDQFKSFRQDKITYQFYRDFWELQKYFMDPNQLTLTQTNKLSTQQSAKKLSSTPKHDNILHMRLKQIQKILNDLILYMNMNPCSLQSNILNQPIKFLTNTNLLQLQLSDILFRKIILCQVIIFTFTLKHLKPNGNILKGVMLTEIQRQTINKIQNLAQRYFQNIQKEKDISNWQESQNGKVKLLDSMKNFFINQLEWLQLKDHWKQKKKAFFRLQSSPITDISTTEISKKTSKQNIDYAKKLIQVNHKISNQMNIQTDTILRFLTQPCIPHIVTTPTQTSFGYYWSQAKSSLQSFNYENIQQIYFQSKNQYNMFQWKAMRSLYRENVKEICLGEKNQKLKEYKCLEYVEKKQRQFKDKHISKKQNPLTQIQQKQTSTINIDLNHLNNNKQVTSQKISAQSPQIQNQLNQEQFSPKKKIKKQ